MYMEEIREDSIWNDFVSQHGPRSGAFLHSWGWGEFQESIGKNVTRYGWFLDEKLSMVAQVIETTLPIRHQYLYCPRGPIVREDAIGPVEMAKALQDLRVNKRVMFFRFDPPVESAGIALHARRTISRQPPNTVLTDLSKDSTKLLASMHQKTRYNLRLAQKKELQIDLSANTPLDEVWPLFEKTSGRGEFRLHHKGYYKDMLENGVVTLATASYKKKFVAANLMIDFAGTRTYLHGASDYEHRQLMAPYLLHWKLIEDAIEQGMDYYDWWGVAPEGDEKHSLAGVSRFKNGFGGERVDYPGTFDIVFDPLWYAFYKFARRGIRKMV